ncbi:STAS domain-containing protein [Actinokineospora sp. NPDC004072]
MTEFSLTTETSPTSARIHIAGALDYLTTDQLVAAASRLIAEPGRTHLGLDFTALTWCDSMGLAGLLQIHRRATTAGVRLDLDNRPLMLDRILALTATLDYLTAHQADGGEQTGPTG